MLALLIELGADVEAADDRGRTPLAVALLRGDNDAARLLRAAGAVEPSPPAPDRAERRNQIIAASKSIRKVVPMVSVRDMRATVDWYRSVGFTVQDAYEDRGSSPSCA